VKAAEPNTLQASANFAVRSTKASSPAARRAPRWAALQCQRADRVTHRRRPPHRSGLACSFEQIVRCPCCKALFVWPRTATALLQDSSAVPISWRCLPCACYNRLMRLVFAVGLMLLAGLVTATVAMITVRLMHANDSASDRQPVPIPHAADVLGHRMSGLIGTPPERGRRCCRPPPSLRRVDGKWVLKDWV
jgi:hypothetical protein